MPHVSADHPALKTDHGRHEPDQPLGYDALGKRVGVAMVSTQDVRQIHEAARSCGNNMSAGSFRGETGPKMGLGHIPDIHHTHPEIRGTRLHLAVTQLTDQVEAFRCGPGVQARADHQRGVDDHQVPAVLLTGNAPGFPLRHGFGVRISLMGRRRAGVPLLFRGRLIRIIEEISRISKYCGHAAGENHPFNGLASVHRLQHIPGPLQGRIDEVADGVLHVQSKGGSRMVDQFAAGQGLIVGSLSQQVCSKKMKLARAAFCLIQEMPDLVCFFRVPHRSVNRQAFIQQSFHQPAGHIATGTGNQNRSVFIDYSHVFLLLASTLDSFNIKRDHFLSTKKFRQLFLSGYVCSDIKTTESPEVKKMLVIEKLSKQYQKGVLALNNLDLTIQNGILGLLGPNGAGKSTLMRILATISKPSSGRATWQGHDITASPESLRPMLGYLPQDFGIYPHLNAVEFLSYLAAVRGINGPSAAKRIHQLLEVVNMLDACKRPLGNLSGGMRQRVGIAQALLNDPRLLIVDEPTAGLDPEERVGFRHLLTELSGDRVVILSSHIVSDIEATATDIAIINKGRLISHERPEVLLKQMEGQVWELLIPSSDLPLIKSQYQVSGTVRTAQGIRVRLIAATKPGADALPLTPSLEEAYLSALGRDKNGQVHP